MTLRFYVIDRQWRVREKYECVVFNLVKSDFEEPFEQFFFQTLIEYYTKGCGNNCNKDTRLRCECCYRIQHMITTITKKWRNIQGTYWFYNNQEGIQLFIDNDLLNAEFTKIRYSVGGEEYENAVEKMKKLINEY